MIKINKIAIISCVFFSQIFLAQNVTLSKIISSNENKDQFLYKINDETDKFQLLGEVEVQGFSDNDAEVYSKFYKKAKQIGANAFSLKKVKNAVDEVEKFDISHYYINLYHVPTVENINKNSAVYIFNASKKPQIVNFDNVDITFSPRSFKKIEINDALSHTLSTKKLLGSSVHFSLSSQRPIMYFQISGVKLNSNSNGNYGLRLKSGDIVGLDSSYAEFLLMIYMDLE